MGWSNGRLRTVVMSLGLAAAVITPLAFAQHTHRNRFEGHAPTWIKGGSDLPFDETAHVMSEQGSHDGQRSEYIQVNAKQQGSYVHYYYPVGKAPVSDELTISLWVKANRPGIEILARVVLPNERDPNNAEQLLTTIIKGDAYRTADRWQRLEVGRSVTLTRKQQQFMQGQVKRQLNFDGAFVDTLVLNVYGGPGTTNVWVDDLEIGPVWDAPPPRIAKDNQTSIVRPEGLSPDVELKGTNLSIANKRIFIRGIQYSDIPPKHLRYAGFNTFFVPANADPALLKEAVELGFWLVPTLSGALDEVQVTSSGGFAQQVKNFPQRDAVLFWNLGNALAYEQTGLVARSAQIVRLADRQRSLTSVDAWDGLARYSSSVNLLGVHRWPLMTTLEMSQYRDWLEQRGRLANPGTFLWTWIQTHVPEWNAQLLYEQSANQAFTAPVGPQPEQIRLLTYTALGAGYRGLAYWSDRFLADSHQGRDRLLCMALINQELEMLEPLLLHVDGPADRIDTGNPDVKAAVLRTAKGVLVLPIWQGKGAQFVPGQSAVANLTITVPQVPQSFQAWEVLPGEVKSLPFKRVPGGTQVTLREFGLTSSIVFTSDLQLLQQFQDLCRSKQKLAAQYAYEMAVEELNKVKVIQASLEKAGQGAPDAGRLLQDSIHRLSKAKEEWDGRLHADAYREAQRAMRPLHILMRSQWERAVKDLDSPVSSPFAVSYYTLPRHLEFMHQLSSLKPAANVLPGGDFETNKELRQLMWMPQEARLDDVEASAQRVSEVRFPKGPKGEPGQMGQPREGQQCLKLEIRPKSKDQVVPRALERTFLAINTPAVRLPAGSLVKVSGWIMIPDPITASPDGALFYDSAAGEPFALRLHEPMGWKQFTLYRRVPASGNINVTLALTGLGTVYFDDVRIEPMN